MAEMTNQVKWAIKQMRDAGFDRKDFSVQVERNWHTDRQTGRRFYEYGDAFITLRTMAVEEKAKAMTEQIIATGLGVVHYKLASGAVLVSITTDYRMRGKFELYDVEQHKREAERILAEGKARAEANGWEWED